MNILALDMATRTGWAIGDGNQALVYGTKDHGPTLNFFGDWAAVYHYHHHWLVGLFDDHNIGRLVIERPFFRGKHYQFFAGLLAVSHKAAFGYDISRTEVAPTQLKKAITGNGKATKAEMIEAVAALGYSPEDDNQADAIALLVMDAQMREAA